MKIQMNLSDSVRPRLHCYIFYLAYKDRDSFQGNLFVHPWNKISSIWTKNVIFLRTITKESKRDTR